MKTNSKNDPLILTRVFFKTASLYKCLGFLFLGASVGFLISNFARQATANCGVSPVITITAASFGGQDVLAYVAADCNGLSSCTHLPDHDVYGIDPFPGAGKRCSVDWNCGGSSMHLEVGVDNGAPSYTDNCDQLGGNGPYTLNCSGGTLP
jgi:hypothetical protein